MRDDHRPPEFAWMARRLREARKHANLHQKDLDTQLELPTGTVKAWENQQTLPTLPELARASQLLGRDLAWFFTDPEALDPDRAAAIEQLDQLIAHLEHKRLLVRGRQVWHVVHSDGKWHLKRQGIKEAEATFDRQKDAIDAGRRTARAAGLAQLLIHGLDGTFQEESTYGDDPKRKSG